MFQVGDLLILKETSKDYDSVDLAEKLMLVVEIGDDPYDYCVIDFCFSKAPNPNKVVRTTKFLEQYYKVYKPQV